MKRVWMLLFVMLAALAVVFAVGTCGGDDDDDDDDDDVADDDSGDDDTGDDDSADDDSGDDDEECPDADEDGFQDEECGGTDCDDTDPDINPDADEVCGDGIDQDCDDVADDGCEVWMIETVDSGDDVGQYASLAITDTGKVGIAYYDADNRDLKYAESTGKAWTIQTAVSDGRVGTYASLVFNSLEDPCIGYYRSLISTGPYYATRTGGAWSTEEAYGGSGGERLRMAIHPLYDVPHMIFYTGGTSVLRYTRNSGGVWTAEDVDTNGYTRNSGLALDSAGLPHVSVQTEITISVEPEIIEEHLFYFRSDGSAWYEEEIDAGPHAGTYNSIAVDDDDYPWIAYTDDFLDDLKAKWWNGSMWRQWGVDTGLSVGEYNSIAIGPDYPGVSYYNKTFGHLMYAEYNGSYWSTQTVDEDGSVGRYTSLAYAPDGYPAIAYYDVNNESLKFARMTYIEEVD